MRSVLAVLVLLALSGSVAAQADEEGLAATEDAALGAIAVRPVAKLSPLEERSRAFPGTIRFRSRGTVTAVILKMKRDMKIELTPVRDEGRLTGLDTTVIDVAGGGKRWQAVLPMSARGTIKATEPKLVNASNILGIDPRIREHLKSGGKPLTVATQIETEGALRDVSITHRLAGPPQRDGTVVIESLTTSEDGGINLRTASTMAPDGLPLQAETSGTVRKGPINVDVAIKLTREVSDEAEETED